MKKTNHKDTLKKLTEPKTLLFIGGGLILIALLAKVLLVIGFIVLAFVGYHYYKKSRHTPAVETKHGVKK